MTNTDQDRFIASAAGRFFDPDGVYAYQCVDTAIAYAIACFPGVPWETSFGRGNANMHYPKDNAYFQSIPNVDGDLNSYPQRGDIVIWGGDSYNPYGHIAVVVEADAYTMLVLQQNADGSAAQPTTLARIGYHNPGTGTVVGWLRPKVAGSAPAPAPAPAGTLQGIDISKHQRGIDIAATGSQFAIIKATEGIGYTDPEFRANLDAARRAGDLVGFYHMARPWAQDGNNPRAEAEWFVSVILQHLGPDDVVVLDWEMDRVDDTAWAAEFQAIVAELTQKSPWIYMNRSHATSLPWGHHRGAWPLWGALYPSNSEQGWGPLNGTPEFDGWNLVAWQYTQTGRLAGHSGTIDLNVFFGDAAAWRTLAAGGDYKAPVISSGASIAGVAQVVVEAGDTLSRIATQFNVNLDALIKANPGINPDLIYPGQVLNLPGAGGPAEMPGAVSKCVVEAGDTLAGIATQFNVDLGALVALNGISNPDLIFPGQVLALPGAAAPLSAGQCVVEAGDTMGAIAAQFGVQLGALIAANPQIANPDHIQVGQVLNLPGNSGPAVAPAPQPSGHGQVIVEAGDTLSLIAAQFGSTAEDIARANGISNPDYIQVGQVLNIP
jgi:LysM repeat protein/GH25 family lysozyme M1 (1,4-beta-N-acetylmuramidase)